MGTRPEMNKRKGAIQNMKVQNKNTDIDGSSPIGTPLHMRGQVMYPTTSGVGLTMRANCASSVILRSHSP